MKLDIDGILALFERFGTERYGEDVTQLDHALQVAGIAREGGGDDLFVAAALLHDIGQFIDSAGNAAENEKRDARHETYGAEMLSGLFPPAVTEPIRLHVDAKRYLCAIEPEYAARLSAASLLSLGYQGGAMTVPECRAFEREPFHRDAVRLRRLDDAGKVLDRRLPALDTYRETLHRAAD